MTRIDIGDSGLGEELLDRRDRLVGNILTPGPSDDERRSVVRATSWFSEGEVRHVIEGFAEDGDGDTELERPVSGGGANEVCEQELADGEGLGDGQSKERVVRLCM